MVCPFFMRDLLVIGTASLDTLRLLGQKTVHSAGGAGLYTALAAQHAGANVTVRTAPHPDACSVATHRRSIGLVRPEH